MSNNESIGTETACRTLHAPWGPGGSGTSKCPTSWPSSSSSSSSPSCRTRTRGDTPPPGRRRPPSVSQGRVGDGTRVPGVRLLPPGRIGRPPRLDYPPPCRDERLGGQTPPSVLTERPLGVHYLLRVGTGDLWDKLLPSCKSQPPYVGTKDSGVILLPPCRDGRPRDSDSTRLRRD